LADEAAAQSEAAVIARELCRDFPERFENAGIIEVFSENGHRVIALPVRLNPYFWLTC
jgi:hypothetical protein